MVAGGSTVLDEIISKAGLFLWGHAIPPNEISKILTVKIKEIKTAFNPFFT